MGVEGWIKTTLGDQVEILTGFPFKSKQFNTEGRGVKLLRGKNITKGFLRWGSDTRYWEEINDDMDKYFLETNDVVISMDGSLVGKNYALIKDYDLPLLLVQRVARLRGKENIDQKFIYYLIDNNQFIQYVDNVKTGTSIPHISVKQIKDYEIKLPPLREQKQIAAILSALDDKIELNHRINQTLEAMAQALYQSWFVDFEPFRDGEFVESELGLIPKGWEVSSLEKVTSMVIDHRGKTPKKLNGEWSKDGFMAISAKNIKKNRLVNQESIKFLNNELYNKWMKDKLQAGDIIMTSEGPLGEFYYLADKEEYCLSQRVFGIRANKEVIFPALLYLQLNIPSVKEDIMSRATGTTVLGIRQSELRKLSILVPPLKEQKKIVDLLTDLLNKVYALEKQSQTLQSLRDTLLPKLMSGEIRVPIEEEASNERADGTEAG